MSYYKILGFEKEPFSTSPDPEFFYLSQEHQAALTNIMIELRLKRGLSVILGDVGLGAKPAQAALLNLRGVFPDETVPEVVLAGLRFIIAGGQYFPKENNNMEATRRNSRMSGQKNGSVGKQGEDSEERPVGTPGCGVPRQMPPVAFSFVQAGRITRGRGELWGCRVLLGWWFRTAPIM